MTMRAGIVVVGLGLVLGVGCSKGSGEPQPPAGEPTTPPASERPSLTSAECQAKGGVVVGDIGDGAIHKPDYVCENGQPPLGTIRAAEGEPVAVEGAVCCGAAAAAS